jgi:hypothetical protein
LRAITKRTIPLWASAAGAFGALFAAERFATRTLVSLGARAPVATGFVTERPVSTRGPISE